MALLFYQQKQKSLPFTFAMLFSKALTYFDFSLSHSQECSLYSLYTGYKMYGLYDMVFQNCTARGHCCSNDQKWCDYKIVFDG